MDEEIKEPMTFKEFLGDNGMSSVAWNQFHESKVARASVPKPKKPKKKAT